MGIMIVLLRGIVHGMFYQRVICFFVISFCWLSQLPGYTGTNVKGASIDVLKDSDGAELIDVFHKTREGHGI
jgi:hypothetical protein